MAFPELLACPVQCARQLSDIAPHGAAQSPRQCFLQALTAELQVRWRKDGLFQPSQAHERCRIGSLSLQLWIHILLNWWLGGATPATLAWFFLASGPLVELHDQ